MTSSDDQSIQSVAASFLCLSKVACGGTGAARALGQQLCVPLDGSSLAALVEHLGQFLHCHACVPAEGSVVFDLVVLLLYSRINKHFSC